MKRVKLLTKYRLTFEALDVHGTQTYTVMAESPEDALAKHNRCESDFEDEELEVQSLSKQPEIEEVEDE